MHLTTYANELSQSIAGRGQSDVELVDHEPNNIHHINNK